MKARIIIMNENGATFEGEVELSQTLVRRNPAKPAKPARASQTDRLNLDMPIRAFVKAHARGLGGPKKFVLLVAYLAKGREDKEVQLRDVEARWNRMTSLLGGKFNRKYSGVARDDGWVDTKKAGVYMLRPSWRQALRAKS